ncbi:MAG: porin, partial [Thiohalobacterales bacterium]
MIDRDQWLGLKGSQWGQVRVGTISTQYKSHGAAIDPIYRTVVQARSRSLQSNFHLGAGEELQGRADNTARYDSPSWNGIKVGGFFTLDSADTTEDDNPYGLALSYENGGILVFGDYMTNDGGDTAGQGDISAWKIGGKYVLNNFSVFGQFEDSEDDSDLAAADGLTVWHLGGTYTMGNNMIYAAYGEGEADFRGGGFDDEEYTTWSIVGIHKMSKRTKVYAGYSAADCDANMNNIYANGMDVAVCKDIEGGTGTGGGDNTAWTAGIKHKF